MKHHMHGMTYLKYIYFFFTIISNLIIISIINIEDEMKCVCHLKTAHQPNKAFGISSRCLSLTCTLIVGYFITIGRTWSQARWHLGLLDRKPYIKIAGEITVLTTSRCTERITSLKSNMALVPLLCLSFFRLDSLFVPLTSSIHHR